MYAGQERHTERRALFIALLILLFTAAAAGAFAALGGFGAIPGLKKAPPAYFAEAPFSVLRLSAPQSGAAAGGEEALRAYFDEAAAYAEAGGFNTLLFDAKEGLSVWWRDSVFPPAAGLSAYDRGFQKLDPLAILCEVLNGRGIQLWLEVRPYEGGTADVGGKSAVERLLAQGGGAAPAFGAADTEYLGLLTKSLAALPGAYPLSGIVLSGFNEAAGAGFAEGLHAFVTQLHTALANGGRLLPLGLAYDESGGAVSPALARGFVSEGLLSYLLPAIPAGALAFTALNAYGAMGAGLVVQPPQNDNGLALFAASRCPALSGVLYGGFPAAAGDAERHAFLSASLQRPDAPLPQGFELPAYLAVNYPAQNAVLYTEEVYVMGNSDPALPLYVDGAELAGRAPKGSFGVALPLNVGDNRFTFSQGGQELTLNVTRRTPGAGGGGGGAYPHDNTREAPAGQALRVLTTIANVLTAPGDAGAINETLPKGAVFICEGSAEALRWNSETGRNEVSWYYRLESGDYVPAVNCEWLGGGASAFTGLSARAHEAGEYLDFEGAGSPAAYIAYDDAAQTLTLTFYDTTLTVPAGFTSELVRAAAVEAEGGAVRLVLSAPDIWGYLIEYEAGTTRLFLKRAPKRSDNPAQPLAGVRVLLDAGHGGSDIGAAGVMGGAGPPNEKDMNLAQAQAIAYRLRQLGAAVELTRGDDTFYSLEERLQMQSDQKPDFFLAVHHNSVELDRDRSDVFGVEGYYYHPYDTPPSRLFAQNLIDCVAAGAGRVPRREAAWYPFYVTRTTVCASVLFEYGFVVNPAEFEDITGAEGLYAAAFATAEALLASLPA